MKILRLLCSLTLGFGLTACLAVPTPAPPTLLLATPPILTPTVSPTSHPIATVTQPPESYGTLTICTRSEPISLYLYSEGSYITHVIQEVLYDGPIDPVNYGYRAVILEKVPSVADGDFVVEKVMVKEGDRVIDHVGEVITLTVGARVLPTGCSVDGCVVVFDGTPLEMARMRVTFKLKSGIQWADGEPLTARDSVFSFQLAREGNKFSQGRFFADRTASYVALDDSTTMLLGLPGFVDDHYFLNFWTPLPKHAWEKYSATELLDREDVTRTPLGYGPYVIEKWISGDRIEARRNDHYFRSAEGLPRFERVVFRFIPAADGQNLLLSGQCDLLPLDTVVEEQIAQWHEADQAGQARLYAIAGPVWEHLTFSINPAPDYDRPDFFEDVRMRQAIAYCIDRQKLADEVLGGYSRVAESYLPSEHVLYAREAVRRYPFDPAQGQALLDEMGWRDEDGDGVREAHNIAAIKNGTALRFDFATRINSLREITLPYIAADLLACGIQAELRFLGSEFFANEPEGIVYGRRFDLAEFAWLTGERPPCELYLSARIPTNENEWTGENVSGYQNPDYDAACEQALSAWPGTEAYLTAHHEAQRLFSEDLPALPLFMRLRFAVSRPDLTGLILDPIEAAETWNIEEFALTP